MPDKNCTEIEIIHPEAVERVRNSMLTEDEYSGIAGLFKNFGDTTRVRILHYLQGGELCVSDLTALLGVTKSAVSHQLQALKLSKLVKSRRDGQIIYYSLDDDHVKLILNMALEHLRE
ncbi:MAG: helix-turn-helix transcriptional regulator [Proteobacteria bacterium]|nr:helix-turn-helix transcriptional regulator [Pseudomonadota bacterium]